MTIDEEKQQLRATIRRLSAQLSPRYREAADRAIYSPHLGGNTGGSFRRAHRNMWENARRIQGGQRPVHIVNGL